MRDDNVADYPWLCFALATLMDEYTVIRGGGVGHGRLVLLFERDQAARAPEVVQKSVVGDAAEPGGELGLTLKGIEMLPGADESFLRNIFGIFRTADLSTDERSQAFPEFGNGI